MTDWNAIRAEYIGTFATFPALSEKYGVPLSTLKRRAYKDGWPEGRKQARTIAIQKQAEKTADVAAENAAIAARIKQKMLRRLEREIDALPDSVGSEMRQSVSERVYDDEKKGRLDKVKDVSKAYNLYDLAQAYMKLTGDMVTDGGTEVPDDGFISALEGSAAEDWNDEGSSV